MGGINHQPCRAYLLNSTRLSRAISLAHARLELGNVALEDILIGELAPGQTRQGTPSGLHSALIGEIDVSTAALHHAQQALADLRRQMDETSFADLPTINKIDLTAIGTDLARHGIVEPAAWKTMHGHMSSGGFYQVLDLFDADLGELIDLSQALSTKFTDVASAVSDGKLTDVVEENTADNFKAEFAKLYTKWNDFRARFLASSIISTELWYAHTGKGSLAPTAAQLRAA